MVPIVQLAEGVCMLQYDQNGLPIDGYDYYQHIAKDEGVGSFLPNPLS